MNKSKEYWDIKAMQKEILALKLHNRHLLKVYDDRVKERKQIESKLFDANCENNRLKEVIKRLKSEAIK